VSAPAIRTGARGAARYAFRRGSAGFTLLEVMVALAVIAIAFTALLGLHARNLRLAARDEAYTRALFLARELVAEIELGRQPPDVGAAEGNFESQHPGEYPGYRWQRDVTPIPLLSSVRQITVRVIPDDPSALCELTFLMRAT
jgi:general secretion pathway protein I